MAILSFHSKSNKFEAVNNVKTNENKLKNEKDNSDEKSNVQENNQAQNVTSSFDENSFTNGHLNNYPNYGEQYGTIIISKIGVNAPIIFGADDETILRGVGHICYICKEDIENK